MKAKLGNIEMSYFYSREHLGKLDVTEYSSGDFLGKFQSIYTPLSQHFNVSGHRCGNGQHQISLVLPINTFSYVKSGYSIKNTVSADGEVYLKRLLEFLNIYGFDELIVFPSAGIKIVKLLE